MLLRFRPAETDLTSLERLLYAWADPTGRLRALLCLDQAAYEDALEELTDADLDKLTIILHVEWSQREQARIEQLRPKQREAGRLVRAKQCADLEIIHRIVVDIAKSSYSSWTKKHGHRMLKQFTKRIVLPRLEDDSRYQELGRLKLPTPRWILQQLRKAGYGQEK